MAKFDQIEYRKGLRNTSSCVLGIFIRDTEKAIKEDPNGPLKEFHEESLKCLRTELWSRYGGDGWEM